MNEEMREARRRVMELTKKRFRESENDQKRTVQRKKRLNLTFMSWVVWVVFEMFVYFMIDERLSILAGILMTPIFIHDFLIEIYRGIRK